LCDKCDTVLEEDFRSPLLEMSGKGEEIVEKLGLALALPEVDQQTYAYDGY
jgi:hypothetical protein